MSEMYPINGDAEANKLRQKGFSVRRSQSLTHRERQERAVRERQRRKERTKAREMTPLYEWMKRLPADFFEQEGYANLALSMYLQEHKRTVRTGPNLPSFVRAMFDEKRRRGAGGK